MALIDTLAQVKEEIDVDLEAAGVPLSSTSFIISSVLGGAWIDLVLAPLDECANLPPSPDEDPEDGKQISPVLMTCLTYDVSTLLVECRPQTTFLLPALSKFLSRRRG